MEVTRILAESLTGLLLLVLVFFLVPSKNSQLRVLLSVAAGTIGFSIVRYLMR